MIAFAFCMAIWELSKKWMIYIKVSKKNKKIVGFIQRSSDPASQAESCIKKIQKLHNFFMSLLS